MLHRLQTFSSSSKAISEFMRIRACHSYSGTSLHFRKDHCSCVSDERYHQGSTYGLLVVNDAGGIAVVPSADSVHVFFPL